MVACAKQTNNKRMAVPGSKQPSTQMPARTRGRLKYRSIKLPKPRLTEQYFNIIIGGHFAMRRPLVAIIPPGSAHRERGKKNRKLWIWKILRIIRLKASKERGEGAGHDQERHDVWCWCQYSTLWSIFLNERRGTKQYV